jgi:hypothetical protein
VPPAPSYVVIFTPSFFAIFADFTMPLSFSPFQIFARCPPRPRRAMLFVLFAAIPILRATARARAAAARARD